MGGKGVGGLRGKENVRKGWESEKPKEIEYDFQAALNVPLKVSDQLM